jgi:predicted Zn-dependent protease
MITQAKCRSLIDVALQHARRKADGIEVTILASDIATSRFANHSVTQNQSPERVQISVRVQKDGRQARLSTDDMSFSAIRRLVDNAITVASFLEKDPTMLPMAKSSKRLKPVNRFDMRTAILSPDARAQAIRAIVDEAKSRGVNSAGVVATGSWAYAIGNSAGLSAFHRQTHAECSITMVGSDSTGWAKGDEVRFADLNVEELARRAAEKAVASANPVELPPGHYQVILEPSAVLDLLAFMWYDFAATSHADKLSCLQGRLGERVFGDNITIVDDAFHPFQAGAPFDGEGLPRRTLTLVESGVVKNLVYGRKSAARDKTETTGHGLSEPNAEGEMPANIVVMGGTTSLSEMIRTSDRAILLTRVWYVREVDPLPKIVTGMTRDGTFLVENGKITRGIKNFRFNQSLVELLNNASQLSPAVRTAGEEGEPAVMPAMKVSDFHFASGTTF